MLQFVRGEWNLTSVFVCVPKRSFIRTRLEAIEKQFFTFRTAALRRLDRVATSALILFYEQTPSFASDASIRE